MADEKKTFEFIDRTAEFEEQDIQQNKTMNILAYISWLVLIPIFAAKESKSARFNANQGLVLAIGETAIGILSTRLGYIPWIGWILSLGLWVVNVGLAVLAVFGIVNSARGQVKELPIIGKIKILK